MGEGTISLIICTRNRCTQLERCLNSIVPAGMRLREAELVIVDNGSTDDTPEVISRFASRAVFPVTRVLEQVTGLSRARNAGIRAARGDIIAFTDDDCYLHPGYFVAVETAFTDGALAFCGGRILLFDAADAFYACNEQSDFEWLPPHSFLPAGKIQGANMVVRREVFERIGLFDPMLGAGTPFRCEDIEFLARASEAGFVGAHVPEVVVYHHHGRKPGAAITQMMRDNDFARGAYYAKFLLRGKPRYLYHWLKITRHCPHHDLRTELRGALAYLRELRRSRSRS